MKKLKPGMIFNRLIYIALFFLAIVLFMEFNGRLEELYKKDVQRDESRQEIYELELTKQELFTQVAYATSEVAVEEWARVSGDFIHPGDVPVAPLAKPNLTPTPVQTPTATPNPVDNWEVWYAVFFGE